MLGILLILVGILIIYRTSSGRSKPDNFQLEVKHPRNVKLYKDDIVTMNSLVDYYSDMFNGPVIASTLTKLGEYDAHQAAFLTPH